MDVDTERHLIAAQELYIQAIKSDIHFGCFDVSLVALGASLSIEDLNRTNRPSTSIEGKLENFGLKVNWVVTNTEPVTANDLTKLLSGEIPFDEEYPHGVVYGYLWKERLPSENAHAMVVFPDQPNSFTVMDTQTCGLTRRSACELAFNINSILEAGGSFEIAQIKKVA